MQRRDTLIMSLNAIRANKLRSSLTLVGIVLGVASIIGDDGDIGGAGHDGKRNECARCTNVSGPKVAGGRIQFG